MPPYADYENPKYTGDTTTACPNPLCTQPQAVVQMLTQAADDPERMVGRFIDIHTPDGSQITCSGSNTLLEKKTPDEADAAGWNQ